MINELENEIINCNKCSRLSAYIKSVALEKKPKYMDFEYWGKPLPGFGDPKAKLLIVGLAPAAHGGNRTGRVFTGDKSGERVFRALYEMGFSSSPKSESREDLVELKGVYVTNAVKCAPPRNAPTMKEIFNCSFFLKREIQLLTDLKVILALGRISFEAITYVLNVQGEFSHMATYKVGKTTIIASYHPSQQNFISGRLTWEKWINVFKKIKSLLDSDNA